MKNAHVGMDNTLWPFWVDTDVTTPFKLERLHSQSKILYNEMLFFDDNERNIIEISKPGVTCTFLYDGATKEIIQQALQTFADRNSNTQM
ncbi:hypothetical protein LSAT2_021038 [Lamellibrachia satsuma]|nr:hypothetical protein LSAT2_021038 [Lamellibrachia satsuma]